MIEVRLLKVTLARASAAVIRVGGSITGGTEPQKAPILLLERGGAVRLERGGAVRL